MVQDTYRSHLLPDSSETLCAEHAEEFGGSGLCGGGDAGRGTACDVAWIQ
jgi:hypothetical protein